MAAIHRLGGQKFLLWTVGVGGGEVYVLPQIVCRGEGKGRDLHVLL